MKIVPCRSSSARRSASGRRPPIPPAGPSPRSRAGGCQRAPDRKRRALHQADQLELLRGAHPHASSSGKSQPVTLFLSRRFSSTVSATSSLSRAFSLRRSWTSLELASSLRISQQALLARLQKLLAPAVVEVRHDAFAAAQQRGDALLAPSGPRSRSGSSLPPRTAVVSSVGCLGPPSLPIPSRPWIPSPLGARNPLLDHRPNLSKLG